MGVHLWAFFPIAAVVIIAPGPDAVLVTKVLRQDEQRAPRECSAVTIAEQLEMTRLS